EQDLADAINAAATDAGYTGTLATVDTGAIVLAADDDESVVVAGTVAVALGLDGTIATGGTDVTGSLVADEYTTANTTGASTGVATAVGAEAASLTLATGALTLQIGENTAVDLAGTYADAQALADTINATVAGAYASYDSTSGELTLSSTEEMTLG